MPKVQDLLGRANVDRLRKLGFLPGNDGDRASPAELSSLEDAPRMLSSALDERSLYEAVLQLFGSLLSQQGAPDTAPDPFSPQQKQQHLNPAEASTLAQVLVGSVLRLDSVEDYTARALTAELALACLELLSTEWSAPLDDQALLSIISYTEVQDPWTTEAASRLGACLTASRLPADRLATFIVGPLLQAYVRPIFSGSSRKVTDSGRPVQFPGRLSSPPMLGQDRTPLWKQGDPSVTSVFFWAVANSTSPVIVDNWPLFLPVLLALVEDRDIHTKQKGLAALKIFVSKCTLTTLRATGIDRLFEDAVFPTLLSLPSLTPEQDSARLLRLAYPALLQLAQADPDPQSHERRRLLDRLIRDGIAAGYFHASQYATIVQVLMHNMATAVSLLGIFSIKHIQTLLNMIDSVMTDPFFIACPSTVVAAVEALDALLSACWPRVSEAKHSGQIIRIITVCWLNLQNQEDETAQVVRDRICERLFKTLGIFKCAWAGPDLEMQRKLDEALSREPRLALLFPEYARPSTQDCQASSQG